eukprot:8461652-Pyramimonas_sp.AAC.1
MLSDSSNEPYTPSSTRHPQPVETTGVTCDSVLLIRPRATNPPQGNLATKQDGPNTADVMLV